MTDTTKRYRLKKDYVTPRFTYAKGADVAYLGGMYVIGIETFTEEALKSTPDWFEEVLVSEPVKEMVGVTVTEMNTYNSRVHYGYSFNVHSVDIDCGKIKQAIESALNDTVDLEMYKLVRDNEALKSLNEQLCSHIDSLNKKIQTPLNDTVLEDKNMSTVYFDKQVLNPHAQGTQAYTNWEQGFMEAANKYFKPQLQSEVDAIRADTWYAARKITDKVVGEIDFKDGDRCPFYEKYFNSINDYLSSLNLNSNDTKVGVAFYNEQGKLTNIVEPTGNNEFVKGWKAGFNQGVEFMAKPSNDTGKGDFIEISFRRFFKGKALPVNQFMLIPVEIFEETKQAIDAVFKKHYPAPEPSALPNKEAMLWVALDILSRIWYYGDFKIETPNERTLAGILYDLGLFPTTEEKIIMRPDYEEYTKKYRNFQLPIPETQISSKQSAPEPSALPNKEQDKPVLFTTDDNVNIYKDGLGIWRVFTGVHSFPSWEPINLGIPINKVEGEKYFSTKEAAEQYILENKPCLSLSDLLDVWGGQHKFDREFSKQAPLYKDLAKIAKQKLNK